MDIMRTSDDTLERIATRVGYSDAFIFSKAFKRVQGISPREFRKESLQV
jgi:AraC-like DNA-binding protein